MLVSFVKENQKHLQNVATGVRILGMDAVLKAKSGHVGLPLGGAEMVSLLYFAAMKVDPTASKWCNRDRFVLSAGHGSMLQYAALHLAGYAVSRKDIQQFRQWGSKTPGHPEFGHTDGIETTTGPLGQGLSNAVGIALAERMWAARFPELPQVGHNTWVIAGDGCLMEGVTSEASSLAGHLKLNRLICLYDDNKITIDGNTDITFTENVADRYKSYGWNILKADGNDLISLAEALEKAMGFALQPVGTTGPTLVICKGIPGKGSPKWEGKHKIHGNPMSADDVVDAKKHLGVEDVTPFAVPSFVTESAAHLNALRGPVAAKWEADLKSALSKASAEVQTRWHDFSAEKGSSRVAFSDAEWALAKGTMATRVASGKALNALAPKLPTLVGGSADLAGSNNTTLEGTSFVSPTSFAGRNVHFGIREHAMGAICNGMATHGLFRPYCATFAVFSDYMRPAIRLSALMKVPATYVLTHDSYAVGEDGPTHQPIEHAAALRAIPGLATFRPADALETFAAWEWAANSRHTPVALLLSRQDLPDLDAEGAQNRSVADVRKGLDDGAYLLKDFGKGQADRTVVLMASGSEVHLALRAARLVEEGSWKDSSGQVVSVRVRVLSVPAPQVFARNPLAYARLVPQGATCLAVEAGVCQGWGELVGREGGFLGRDDFGASAPASVLSEKFGFTASGVAGFVTRFLKIS